MCLAKPGVRYLIGRSRLTSLKSTTLKTLMDLFKEYKIEYNYNQIQNSIKFKNESEIVLMELYPYPSDSDFDRLGSLEITGAFIDELSEITRTAFDVLSSRIRYKLNEYNLIPKIFCASNPSFGWPKEYFYTRHKRNELPDYVKFIPALPQDNPYLPESYIESLKKLSIHLRKRLLEGSWDYVDDDYLLLDYDDICNLFYQVSKPGDMYLSCDVANIGKDKTIIGIWNGLSLIKIFKYDKTTTPEVINLIKQKMVEYKVSIRNVVIDADGLGVGVSDFLRGCKAFKGGSSALHKNNYRNLRSQCYFELKEKISEISIVDDMFKDNIIKELQSIRIGNVDSDQKTSIEGKDKIKERIGHSPDYADMIMMRMVFEIEVEYKVDFRFF
jgi:hypothetical protein